MIIALVAFIISGCTHSPDLPQHNEVKCIGHRGDTSEQLENSPASFLAALNNNADGIEFDVRETADGTAIVMHDIDLSDVALSRPGKVCPIKTPINRLTFDEITNNCQLKNGEDIPKLETVLSTFQSTNLFLLIEFKTNPGNNTLNLFNIYYTQNPEKIISIISFNIDYNNAIETRDRFKTTTLLNREVYQPDFYEIFDGVDVLDIATVFIKRLQYEGKIISLYGINSLENTKEAFDLRAHYITTDNLQNCLAVKNET